MLPEYALHKFFVAAACPCNMTPRVSTPLWASMPIGRFEYARETGSRASLNCTVGMSWETHFHHCMLGARIQVARK